MNTPEGFEHRFALGAQDSGRSNTSHDRIRYGGNCLHLSVVSWVRADKLAGTFVNERRPWMDRCHRDRVDLRHMSISRSVKTDT